MPRDTALACTQFGDSRKATYPEGVQLVIAHLPYMKGSLSDHVEFLGPVLRRCVGALTFHGVIVTVGNDPLQRGVLPKHAEVARLMGSYGFRRFDHKIWDRGGFEMYRMTFSHIQVFARKGVTPWTACKRATRTPYRDGVWTLPLPKHKGYSQAFPPEIPRWLIQHYTGSGDKVLDPFSGSGTTLREALKVGRVPYGIELDRGLSRLIQRLDEEASNLWVE